ncbi:MAG TPA: PD-(D/E)XK nuclease family protein [Bacteroidales bacterium]|nr:PD-(D/E)XK nuclease family protein [Bacteroidales bacterium]HRZ49695.1 PD-(D/E)XK nuclease family protein [Bacteroidales bacterium]
MRIILPGKRARLFLFREWAVAAGKPVWAPEVSTMEEFVFSALGLEPADELALTLNLWEICRSTPETTMTFEQFSGWAPIALRDFNDVDLFLANPVQVFANLRDAKELQFWEPGRQEGLSGFELQYLAFYDHLLPWYNALRERMLAAGMAWQGLAFRMLADDKTQLQELFAGKQLVFAGFNAFSPAEEQIVKTLKDAGIARLLWDADKWYVQDPLQEAGMFIRGWQERNPEADVQWIGEELSSGAKEIRIYGVHGNRAQARLAGEILGQAGSNNHQTALVLPDETLLLPVLNSLPPVVERFNVTMGLPFGHTPAWSWLRLNLQLFAPAPNYRGEWIRVASLVPLLRHPWFNLMLAPESNPNTDPLPAFRRRYITANDLYQILTEVYPASASGLKHYLAPVSSPVQFVEKMEASIRLILSNPRTKERPFDKGALLETLRILKAVHGILDPEPDAAEGFAILRHLLMRLLQGASVPFTGEPLEGVQIMGLLETRNLDFRHVILLSANEKILPPARKPLSLIPSDLRVFHGLPGVRHQDAIAAYHFYHLLQRAKRVDIIYNTDLSSEQSGEMSRFIRQVEQELVPANPLISCHHTFPSDPLRLAGSAPPVTIAKTPAVYDTLLQRMEARLLSPSQLISYIQCPLKFFFSYVAGIREPESFVDSLDQKEFGTLVHEALKDIYTPLLSTSGNPGVPDKAFYDHAITRADAIVGKCFSKLLGSEKNIRGLNVISREMAAFMVQTFLRKEALHCQGNPPALLSLELYMEHHLLAGTRKVTFRGLADRVDQVDGITRISDYKTGKVDSSELKMPSIQDLFTDPAKEKVFQLMMYVWMYSHHHPDATLTAAIFPLRSSKDYAFGIPELSGISSQDFKAILADFQEALANLCTELLDPAVPFRQTDDPARCRYCPYQPVCLPEI